MSAPTEEQLLYYQTHASDNRQASLWATNICCIIFPVTFVLLRLIARYRTRAPLKADDWLVLVSLLPMMGMSSAGMANTWNGQGRHILFVKKVPLFVQLFITGITTYCVAMTLAKLSVMSLYRRIFPTKEVRISTMVVSVIVTTYCLALILVGFLQCIPLDSIWTGKPGTCIDVGTAYVALAIVNVVTDCVILALPVRSVLNLKMRPARKIQVLGMFLLGGVVCVFGIIRTVAVATVSQTDQSWTSVDGTIWSTVEVAVAIISSNLPVIRPLFVRNQTMAKNHQSGCESGSNNSHKKDAVGDWSKPRSTWSIGTGKTLEADERPFAKMPEPYISSTSEGTGLVDIRVETKLQQHYHPVE